MQEALQPILDGFRWLGLDWDEGPTPDGGDSTGPHAPYFQSQRGQRYSDAAQQLLASGHAYRDFATAAEIQSEREAAEREKRPFVYSRRWMAEDDEQASTFEASGRKSVVRPSGYRRIARNVSGTRAVRQRRTGVVKGCFTALISALKGAARRI